MALLESTVAAVTPSDTVDLPVAGQLFIGVGASTNTGFIKVDAGGGTVTFKNIPSGTWLGIVRVTRVYASVTTCTDIIVAH